MIELTGGLTEQGEILFGNVQIGTVRLEITRAAAGGGETAVGALTLADERQALAVGEPRWEANTAILPVTLLAEEAAEAYTLTEVGVYARDPEQGEILYRLYRLGTPLQINPSAQESALFYLKETLGAAETVVVEESKGYLLEKMKGKPHGVAELNEEARVPAVRMPDGLVHTTVLWENASPGSAFQAQSLTLDWASYDFIEVVFTEGAPTAVFSVRNPSKVLRALWGNCSIAQITLQSAIRNFFFTDTGVDIGVTVLFNNNSGVLQAEERPDLIIPVVIYGHTCA